tara:strand:- start:6105 stop:6329 length:225 start_codon:yes stop_codon:yes gene_type:complete
MSQNYKIEASWEKIIEDDYDTALKFLMKARADVNEHFDHLSEEQKIDLVKVLCTNATILHKSTKQLIGKQYYSN